MATSPPTSSTTMGPGAIEVVLSQRAVSQLHPRFFPQWSWVFPNFRPVGQWWIWSLPSKRQSCCYQLWALWRAGPLSAFGSQILPSGVFPGSSWATSQGSLVEARLQECATWLQWCGGGWGAGLVAAQDPAGPRMLFSSWDLLVFPSILVAESEMTCPRMAASGCYVPRPPGVKYMVVSRVRVKAVCTRETPNPEIPAWNLSSAVRGSKCSVIGHRVSKGCGEKVKLPTLDATNMTFTDVCIRKIVEGSIKFCYNAPKNEYSMSFVTLYVF